MAVSRALVSLVKLASPWLAKRPRRRVVLVVMASSIAEMGAPVVEFIIV